MKDRFAGLRQSLTRAAGLITVMLGVLVVLTNHGKAEGKDYYVIYQGDKLPPNIIGLRHEYMGKKIEYTGELTKIEEKGDQIVEYSDYGTDYIAVVRSFVCPLDEASENFVALKKLGEPVTVRGTVVRIDTAKDLFQIPYFLLYPCSVMPPILEHRSMYYNVGLAWDSRGDWAIQTGRNLDEAKANALKECNSHSAEACQIYPMGIDDHSGGGCYALIRSGIKLYFQISRRDNFDEARASAKGQGLSYCQNQSNFECRVEVLKCNDERP